MKGVAWMRLLIDGQCPIIRCVAKAVLLQLEGVDMRMPDDFWKKCVPAKRRIFAQVQDTARFFQENYGLSMNEILAFEFWFFQSGTPLPAYVNHPVLERVMDVDSDSL
jgi:hypothetical protein